MIKNQSNIYRFPMEDCLGRGVTGLAPTIKLSKDGGAFVASANSVTEPDTTNAPGLYQLILTAEECNCNLLTLVVNVPTGEWGAIFNEFEIQSATDISSLATSSALSDVATAVTSLQTQLTSVLSGIYHWEVENDVLTIYNDNNTAIATYALTKDNEGNIIAVTPTTENA